MSSEFIEINGVETNNLKSLNVKIPLYKLTAVTGVSGSGKSSLVFDTLYAESYRRYVESLSSFARQYLKAMPKPKISGIRNLPPAIAVQQSRSGATNRSTVGTLTELHDALRVVFAQCGEIFCTKCGRKVMRAQPDVIAKFIVSELNGKRIYIATGMDAWESVSDKELKTLLLGQGFLRLLVHSELVRIEDVKKFDRVNSLIVVDRIQVGSEFEKRIAEASALALKLGRGRTTIVVEEAAGKFSSRVYSNRLECCAVNYSEPTMALFSFNHPLGACETCQGFGSSTELDRAKIIPDMDSSLSLEGIACWNFGDHRICYTEALKSAVERKLDVKKKKFSQFSKSEMEWLWNGDGKKFDGINGYFAWLDTKRYKAHYRIHASRFRKYVTCPTCLGQRLNLNARAVKLGGKSITEVAKLDIKNLLPWFTSLSRAEKNQYSSKHDEGQGADEAIAEAVSRLNYLQKMGLSYLSLERSAKTLSGGELQRINMSRCLGSVLTETLFCLDEPTAGLHARDSENLLGVIRDLQDQGNTVVVVEHEKTIINGSDYFIEIGPMAGHEGGYIVFEGEAKERPSKKPQMAASEMRNEVSKWKFFKLENASIHNLKSVSVSFPVGKITAVCGVSGSGKTSLIKHSLYPLLTKLFDGNFESEDAVSIDENLGTVGPLEILKIHETAYMVSQISLGRSSRSTVATYLDIMDHVRKLFAAQESAKRLGLTAGSFSFNSVGGRCENCRGLGTVVEDLSFLGEMEVICPSCNGARFQEAVLSVQFKGKNLIDVLAMTVAEARTFFFEQKHLVASLDAVLKVGMGYVTLGQSTSSFSGGEAQRLKLVQIMADSMKGKPSILIFDEPTTGLSDSDVDNLFEQFKVLSAMGHTVIIVEHHLNVLKKADWLIEMGPDAADMGGEVVYCGVPLAIQSASRSVTKKFLQ